MICRERELALQEAKTKALNAKQALCDCINTINGDVAIAT